MVCTKTIIGVPILMTYGICSTAMGHIITKTDSLSEVFPFPFCYPTTVTYVTRIIQE